MYFTDMKVSKVFDIVNDKYVIRLDVIFESGHTLCATFTSGSEALPVSDIFKLLADKVEELE